MRAETRPAPPHSFHICPTNPKVIESRADLPGARWCFWMVTDSKAESGRIVGVLNGNAVEDAEQLELLGATL